MQISLRPLLDPRRNAVYGIAAVTWSVLAFAYSAQWLGSLSILLFYLLWLAPVALDHRILTDDWPRLTRVLLVPLIALLSVLWSEVPSVSLRSGLQFTITIVAAVVAARLLTFATMVKGVLAGSLAVLVLSYVNGRFVWDAIEQVWIYAGAFDSKNQLGLYASIAIIFGLIGLLLVRVGLMWRLVALLAIGVGVGSLSQAYSVTSTVSLAAIFLLMIAGLIGLRTAPALRTTVLLGAGLAILVVLVLVTFFPIVGLLLSSVGKSTTLTGRTDLWDVGLSVAREHPVLGIGYQAFWTKGNPPAEQLWALFGILDRTGFHFHSVWVQSLVEIGLVGCAAMALTFFATLWAATRDYATGRDARTALALVALNVLFLVRSFVELDFFVAHTIGTFLVFHAAAVMAKPWAAPEARQPVTAAWSVAGTRPA